MSLDRGMDKEEVVHINNGIVFSLDRPVSTSRGGMGRELQKGGDPCIPMADSC